MRGTRVKAYMFVFSLPGSRTPCWSLWEGDGRLAGRDRGDRGTRGGLSAHTGEEVILDEIRIGYIKLA